MSVRTRFPGDDRRAGRGKVKGRSFAARTDRTFIYTNARGTKDGRKKHWSVTFVLQTSTSVTEQVGQMMHIMFAPLENCENLRVTCCQAETKTRMNNSNSERGKEGKRQAPTVMMVMALVYVASFFGGANPVAVETSGCNCYFQALQLPCSCCY